jgi:hypothetical protein
MCAHTPTTLAPALHLQSIAAKMLHLSKKVNELKQRDEAENMEKRTIIWKNAENSFNDFPLLDENEMCPHVPIYTKYEYFAIGYLKII